MSTDKEKLNELAGKMDEILVALNKITGELRSIQASMKSMAVGQITQPPSAAPQPPPVASPSAPQASSNSKMRSLDDTRMSFPEELEAKLSFEEKNDFIIIKPKQFLGSENFAKIASAVRGMGGEYISAGKDSHFRVPKKKA